MSGVLQEARKALDRVAEELERTRHGQNSETKEGWLVHTSAVVVMAIVAIALLVHVRRRVHAQRAHQVLPLVHAIEGFMVTGWIL